jgi:CDP-4-dehydro-6-deoxyglucose reductase, E1
MHYNLSDNTWGKEEKEAIQEVVESNKFTMGEKTKIFEEKFAKYFNSRYAIMVNSGSSANLLAIAALVYSGKLKKGDEVIVPAVSWSTTYYPVCQHGLRLKFVDIDLNTLNLDLSKVEKAITDKTKAILTVNLLGNPNDYEKLEIVCSKNNLLLIEDNCEALGAKFNDKYCGTFGILGTFSTYFSHHICTMEGGVVVTDDEKLYHYMLSIRSHGWTRHLPENTTIYKKSGDAFYESFNFILPGYNLRPLEMEAAVGIKQIDKIENIINARRHNAALFLDLFKDHPNIICQKEIGSSSWFGFSMVLKNDLLGRRPEVVDKLTALGIEVRPIVAGNFTKNDAIKYLDYDIFGELTQADYIHDNGLFVGNHSRNIKSYLNVLYDTMTNI